MGEEEVYSSSLFLTFELVIFMIQPCYIPEERNPRNVLYSYWDQTPFIQSTETSLTELSQLVAWPEVEPGISWMHVESSAVVTATSAAVIFIFPSQLKCHFIGTQKFINEDLSSVSATGYYLLAGSFIILSPLSTEISINGRCKDQDFVENYTVISEKNRCLPVEVGIQTDNVTDVEVVSRLKAEVELLKHQVSNYWYSSVLMVSLPCFSSEALLSCTPKKEIMINIKYKINGKMYIRA